MWDTLKSWWNSLWGKPKAPELPWETLVEGTWSYCRAETEHVLYECGTDRRGNSWLSIHNGRIHHVTSVSIAKKIAQDHYQELIETGALKVEEEVK